MLIGLVALLVHECLHAPILRWVTGVWPTIELRRKATSAEDRVRWYSLRPCCYAPGWWIARRWFAVVLLAPAIGLTLLAVLADMLLHWFTGGMVRPALVSLVVAVALGNLFGAVGDLSWFIRLCRVSPPIWSGGRTVFALSTGRVVTFATWQDPAIEGSSSKGERAA